MSWLRFSRSSERITLYGGAAPNFCALSYPNQIGDWPAHNNAASTSKGRWPAGVHRWSHYNAHAEAGVAPVCHNTAYGCTGIHVFSVAGRAGMGVHAGRTQGQDDVLGGKTLGCIRVPANAMQSINDTHRQDPLEAVVVY